MYLKKDNLRIWLQEQIEIEQSCIEDFELVDGEEYSFGRGKVAAWTELLKIITKGD